MIWYVYALLMSICFIALILAYTFDLVYWKVIGYGFLFIVNFMFINPFGAETIQYQVGFNESYMYGDNFTGYHWDYSGGPTPAYKEIELFHRWRTPLYEDYTNLYIFSFLSLIGLVGTCIFTFDEYKNRRERRERE